MGVSTIQKKKQVFGLFGLKMAQESLEMTLCWLQQVYLKGMEMEWVLPLTYLYLLSLMFPRVFLYVLKHKFKGIEGSVVVNLQLNMRGAFRDAFLGVPCLFLPTVFWVSAELLSILAGTGVTQCLYAEKEHR